MEKHVPNMLAALWAVGFLVLLAALSRLVRPNRSGSTAKEAFNSGEVTHGKPWTRMSARYQVLIAVAAMFFLGVLLLFPPIATFREWLNEGNGVTALLAVGLFLATLTVALAHAWTKGDLSWVSDVEKEEHGDSGKRVS